MCSSNLSFISKGFWQKSHIGLCTGSSKSVHEEMFMCPVNSSLLLKLLRQIMQLPNLPHDENSIVLLNFVICFNGLLAVRTGYLLDQLLNKFPCAQ